MNLNPPNWTGGPPMCPEHNLPCFDTREDAMIYIARFCPGAKIMRVGKCQSTGKIHFESKARSPSGDSSGSSRRYA